MRNALCIGRREPLASWGWRARVLAVASLLCACSVDTVVFEQRSAATLSPQRDAGSGAGRAVFGCGIGDGSGGAAAILQRIVDSASEAGEWIRPERSCTADRDCRSALLTPACNTESTRCGPCPALPERIAYLSNLGSCLSDAIADCCADPEAEQDCVLRKCQSGCGPQ